MLSRKQEALSSDKLYRPAERVPETGIYETLHPKGETSTVVLVREQQFPACADCGTQVRFRLVRTAPHISEDEDFR
ncbi:MAG: hypothetical protein L0Z53_10175 [Acidobacteriales bacterium]|nr:hypothetical protein [Terriglobales bacterium]